MTELPFARVVLDESSSSLLIYHDGRYGTLRVTQVSLTPSALAALKRAFAEATASTMPECLLKADLRSK